MRHLIRFGLELALIFILVCLLTMGVFLLIDTIAPLIGIR